MLHGVVPGVIWTLSRELTDCEGVVIGWCHLQRRLANLFVGSKSTSQTAILGYTLAANSQLENHRHFVAASEVTCWMIWMGSYPSTARPRCFKMLLLGLSLPRASNIIEIKSLEFRPRKKEEQVIHHWTPHAFTNFTKGQESKGLHEVNTQLGPLRSHSFSNTTNPLRTIWSWNDDSSCRCLYGWYLHHWDLFNDIELDRYVPSCKCFYNYTCK